MQNDEQEGDQQLQGSQTDNPGATGEVSASNNGDETTETGHEITAEANGKRAVSSRKLEANRQNGRKGTGPKTPAGKKSTVANSLSRL